VLAWIWRDRQRPAGPLGPETGRLPGLQKSAGSVDA